LKLEFENCEKKESKINYKELIKRTGDILEKKCDKITAIILQNMEKFNIVTNENFLIYKSAPSKVLGIWGNLTKNPRYKSIELTDAHISVSIPKPFSLANVAVRILLDNSANAASLFEEQDTEQIMSVVGGVLHLNLLELPELAKNVEKWVIRPCNF
jgi:hypothetical protein